MNEIKSSANAADKIMTEDDFITTIAPMTATSGQIDILQDIGQITENDTILELWCGGGDLTAQLAKIGGRVIGSDYSQKLIAKAQIRFPHLEFVVSEADKIIFPDEQFDVVVSNFIAHHYSNPEKNFGEAKRVLKPGGRHLVTMPIQSKRVGFNLILGVAREFLDLPERPIKGGPLQDIESPDEIVDLMKLVGFKKIYGIEQTNNTILTSIDTLLNYAWSKLDLQAVPLEIQDQIRAKSIEYAQRYKLAGGSYQFPDRIIAVRGEA